MTGPLTTHRKDAATTEDHVEILAVYELVDVVPELSRETVERLTEEGGGGGGGGGDGRCWCHVNTAVLHDAASFAGRGRDAKLFQHTERNFLIHCCVGAKARCVFCV